MKRRDRIRAKRPRALGQMVATYNDGYSRIPDSIRVSFEDGSTGVYQLRNQMPGPVVEECCEIIRKMKSAEKMGGYTPPSLRKEAAE